MTLVDKWLPSIQQRLMVALLAPLLVLCTVLAGYMATVRHNDLTEQLMDSADTTSRYLADSAGFALFSGNQRQLRTLASSVMAAPEITAVTFVDAAHSPVLSVGRPERTAESGFALAGAGTAALSGSRWLIHRPVIAEQVVANDFDEQTVAPAVLGHVLVELDNQLLLRRQAESLRGIALVAALVLLAAVVAAIQISRSITGPLRRLTRSVEQIAAGHTEMQVYSAGPRELALLADVLRRQLAQTRDYSARLERDVDKATAQLLAAMNDLEEAMVAKDQFMAKMSHELRTPLTAVIGFTAALADESGAAKREEYQRIIASSSQLLLKTIDDVLEFARSNSGELKLENGRFNLRDTLSDLLAIHRERAVERGLELVLQVDANLPQSLWGDSMRIAQIFNNLIGNALKFTERGSVLVTVALGDVVGDRLLLNCCVKDSGKGIAAARIRHLFSPFAQEDDSISRQFGGSGLGLSISRSLVELMGGKIAIHSQEGEGTAVEFSLRLRVDDQAAEQTVPGSQAELFAGKLILIAEDHPYNQKLLQRMLEQCGANTVVVDNGALVLDELSRRSVDLLLLDIHMPVMDGVQTARAIANLAGDGPPIVGLTADVSRTEHQAMLAAGAAQVLVKPIDQQLLLATIAELFDRPEPTSVGDGLLASGEVPAELISTLVDTLTLLREALGAANREQLRGALHDLMGLSGLYGMNDLRAEVLAFRAALPAIDEAAAAQRIDTMLALVESRASRLVSEQRPRSVDNE